VLLANISLFKMHCRYVEIFKSSMLEAESAIEMQGKYIPGMGASGGGRPTPYDRQGRGTRGARGVGGRGRGGGNIKGLMGMYVCNGPVL